MFALRSLDGQLELLNVFIAIVYQNPKVSNFQFEWTFYLLASIYLIFLITKLLFLKGIITASLRLVITISPFLLIYMYLLRFKNLDLKIGWMQKIWLVCLPLTRFFFLHYLILPYIYEEKNINKFIIYTNIWEFIASNFSVI